MSVVYTGVSSPPCDDELSSLSFCLSIILLDLSDFLRLLSPNKSSVFGVLLELVLLAYVEMAFEAQNDRLPILQESESN